MVHRSCVDAVRSLLLLATEFAMSRPYLSSSIMIFLVVLLGQSPAKADEPKRLVDIGGTVPLDARTPAQPGLRDRHPGRLDAAEGDAFRDSRSRGTRSTDVAATCTAGTTATSGSAASRSAATAEGDIDVGAVPGHQAVRQLLGWRRLARRDARGAGPSGHGPGGLPRLRRRSRGHRARGRRLVGVPRPADRDPAGGSRKRRLGPHQLRRLPAARRQAIRPASATARDARRLRARRDSDPRRLPGQ